MPRVRFFTGTLRRTSRVCTISHRAFNLNSSSATSTAWTPSIEIDGRLGALEVVALRDFLACLVQRVVHFLQIDVRVMSKEHCVAMCAHVNGADRFLQASSMFMHMSSWHDDRRPRVGISRCLLGDEVRHDGGHKRDDLLLSALGSFVQWVPVCPEVEAGMGTPREAIDLVASDDGVTAGGMRVHLLGAHSRTDWTSTMVTFAAARVRQLLDLDLDGYVLKRTHRVAGSNAFASIERKKCRAMAAACSLKRS